MTKKSKTIVFFGSGPVAAKSLQLLAEEFEVVAVITKPKPIHHRGAFPVIDAAQELSLPIYTVSNKHELSELIKKQPFTTEAAVLIDFGIIVSQDVIDYFPKGIVNSHFSLLPEWRGADPITFAILSGQKKTGVSLMLLVEAMDEGPVIACGVQELDGTETTPVLTDHLIHLSHALLKKELPRYLDGETRGIAQAELSKLIPGHPDTPTYSRKLTKEDGILDFDKPAEQLEREVRAFAEWPKSRMNLAGIDVVITSAFEAGYEHGSGDNGYVFAAPNNLIGVQTSTNVFLIEKLKPAGKPEMTAQAFLAGYGKKLGLL